jgi:hypothetical protein
MPPAPDRQFEVISELQIAHLIVAAVQFLSIIEVPGSF